MGAMMSGGMMGGGAMMWGMGILWSVIVVLLLLCVASLIKYLLPARKPSEGIPPRKLDPPRQPLSN